MHLVIPAVLPSIYRAAICRNVQFHVLVLGVIELSHVLLLSHVGNFRPAASEGQFSFAVTDLLQII